MRAELHPCAADGHVLYDAIGDRHIIEEQDPAAFEHTPTGVLPLLGARYFIFSHDILPTSFTFIHRSGMASQQRFRIGGTNNLKYILFRRAKRRRW
ncbi:MAG TPA: hypothetical protein VN229_03685 [Terriglobales bacterium]|nr:hypothetical protein [Terriglobales bacterium]